MNFHKETETFRRPGCICTGEWPMLGEPVIREQEPRNREERRAAKRAGRNLRTTYYPHIHMPQCEALWLGRDDAA
jgi:hypothetical protein